MDGAFWWCTLTLTFIVFVVLGRRRRRSTFKCQTSLTVKSKQRIPSPPKMPIIGHLYLFQGNPIIEMTKLSKKYGDIYKLHLGSVETVVVTSLSLIKETLIQKGGDFGDRPNFLRYTVLFGNDKDNSLAFCDWSEVQKTRRSLARRFCHTGLFSDRVDKALQTTTDILITQIKGDVQTHGNPFKKLKIHLQKACANIFFDFFCSQVVSEWGSDSEFEQVVQLFDHIFWEINQSHVTDVLPFLAPFFHSHLNKLGSMGTAIRQYVIKNIITPHKQKLDTDDPQDFVDILLTHLEDSEPNCRLTEEQVLYELEDFLGGHSAVSNLLCRALVEIAGCPGLSQKIYEEHFEKQNKDYVQAVIYETLRRTCSPIVPHVASRDSSIGGYDIKKGTMIMINNYELNSSQEFWQKPNEFIPERFLRDNNGRFKRPSHFFPFSYGKRACMGYQLVEKVTEGLITSLIQNFHIHPMTNPTHLPTASVAINPKEDLRVRLVPRE